MSLFLFASVLLVSVLLVLDSQFCLAQFCLAQFLMSQRLNCLMMTAFLSLFSVPSRFFFKQDSPCLSMFFTFRCQKHVSLVLRVSMTTFLKNDETQRIHLREISLPLSKTVPCLRGSVFYISMPEICFACLSLFLMSQCLKDVLCVSYLKGIKFPSFMSLRVSYFCH